MAEADRRKAYPLDAGSYKLLHEIGSGVSAVVYKAVCLPMNSAIVAIKSIDLERSKANLEDVRREAKTMALLSHSNILRAHCSFTVNSHLWVVMPFMAAGSLHSILSFSFHEGLPEPSIAIVLKDVLHALSYLHGQGHVHRDIKAGNILLDSDGSVKLADFGVSASIYESHSSSCSSSVHLTSSSSTSFCSDIAGTPYWMAPEVIHSRVGGYGIKADIWSFGITALELAHGRPPLSHLPLSKSLLMKITSRLRLEDTHDRNGKDKKKKFSKAFKDMVSSCLSHDPSRRPSADKLLRHPFFKNCKSSEYLVRNVLLSVPTVEERFMKYREYEANCFDDNNGRDGSLSPNAKSRRISGWNFNEDIFKMDPVYPIDKEKDSHKECVRSTREEIIDKPCDQKSLLLDNKHTLTSNGERGISELREFQQGKVIKSIEGITEEAQLTKACNIASKPAVFSKESLVPSLVLLLSSLDMQRAMVMNALAQCRGELQQDEDAREQREKCLLGLVQSLQQTVDDLNLQLEMENKRKAYLEETLDNLRQNKA